MSTAETGHLQIKTHAAQGPEQEALSYRLRHELFCEGGAGEILEVCKAARPEDPHDTYDSHSLFFWGTINDRPVSSARLILGPDLQSAATLRQLGSEFARLLPRRYQRKMYEWFVHLRLPVRLLLAWWLRRWAEPSRLGLAQEYQHTAAGRALVLRHLGQMTAAAIKRGHHECLITMRPGVFGIISFMPLRLGTLFAYPSTAGGPASDDPIRAVSVNFHEVVAAVMYHSNPDMRRAMFGDEDLDSLIDWSQVRDSQLLADQARETRKAHSSELRRWRQGELTLPQVS